MTISQPRRSVAYATLRGAGFTSAEVRELLAGPKGLRDELAGQAIAGMVSSPQGLEMPPRRLAFAAYQVADACMIERDRRNENND